MSLVTARRAVSYFASRSADTVRPTIEFTGGEPLTDAGLLRSCVAHARAAFGARDVRFRITTNGTLIPQDVARLFIDNDFDVVVSVDGPKAVHDRYRRYPGGRGSFDAIARNLQRLRVLAPDYIERRVSFHLVLAPPYRFSEIEQFLDSGGLILPTQRLSVSFVSGRGTSFLERFSPIEGSTEPGYTELWRKYPSLATSHSAVTRTSGSAKLARALFDHGLHVVYELGIAQGPHSRRRPMGACLPGTARLLTTTDGRYLLCDRADPTSDALQVGDVLTGIDTERACQLLNDFLESPLGLCRTCWAYRMCGICFIHAERDGMLDSDTVRRHCAAARAVHHRNLILMAEVLAENPAALSADHFA